MLFCPLDSFFLFSLVLLLLLLLVLSATMAADDAVDRVATGENATNVQASKQAGLHGDVEVGAEAIDLDRIERVYA